jgi:PGF-CTERM protein
MAFTYEDFNNAWFTEDCPDDSGTVTFNLVKTDGGELPDDTAEDDWGEIDMNKFPICAYAYAMMLPDGEFDVRMGIGAAPESGDYIIDLVDGAEYMISVVCSDPEGDDMTVTINNADLNLTSTYTSTAIAEASLLLSVPAGYDGTYIFDVTWTDGHHNEAGTLTVNGLGDGSGGDLSADGDGFLPGFTAALGIVALLGAAMIGSRRNRA